MEGTTITARRGWKEGAGVRGDGVMDMQSKKILRRVREEQNGIDSISMS
jgi:hypothetical protein